MNEVTKSGKLKNEVTQQLNIPPSTLSTVLRNKSDNLRKYESDKRTTERTDVSEYPEVGELNLFVRRSDKRAGFRGEDRIFRSRTGSRTV